VKKKETLPLFIQQKFNMKLRIYSTLICLLIIGLFACKSPKKEHAFKISGTMKGYSDGTTLWLLQPRLNAEGADTLATAKVTEREIRNGMRDALP
jgi:hypothetical protein